MDVQFEQKTREENAGETVEDARTGGRITFLDRGVDEEGAYLSIEGVLPVDVSSGPARYHPRAAARAEVIAGRAIVELDGEERILLPGKSTAVTATTPHAIRNDGAAPLIVHTIFGHQVILRLQSRDSTILKLEDSIHLY
ncbi:cupin domain-containing protein [Halococcus hamelinensis]|uniref:Cupin type-2 domain-containing protein n=1 Tax=Halococcus hamelinensis 100A6 TaxID=1132509 RepID=M0LZF7_9EURY|nr:cupin domain-containing protein [Halococcus hamelinensis]EMA37759.1 hypothetical protein C447_12325 [Halococcus hamelinensis 100A6]